MAPDGLVVIDYACQFWLVSEEKYRELKEAGEIEGVCEDEKLERLQS